MKDAVLGHSYADSMNSNIESHNRSPLELVLLAVAIAGVWMAGAGLVLANYCLAAFGAAVLLGVVCWFMNKDA
jgi:hypothetical protein